MQRSKESHVWSYFQLLSNGGSAKCNLCSDILMCRGLSTSGLLRHLTAKHSITTGKKSQDINIIPSTKRLKSGNQPTIISSLGEKESIGELVAKLVACDGFSINGITNSSFIRSSFTLRGYMLPKNHSDVMQLVYKQYEIVKDSVTSELQKKKEAGVRFSLSLDEYTSLQNRRFMNINIHYLGGFINLGMIALKGKIDANIFNQLIQMKLEEFKLSYADDIVCSVTDGASVMVKMGRLSPCKHQQCMAHGIHLSVCDVLYKSRPSVNIDLENTCEDYDILEIEEVTGDNIEISIDDDITTFVELRDDCNIKTTIQKVRRIVKLFRKSPKKNDMLQTHVKSEFHKELMLILDTKTRWNSLLEIIERFLKLKKCIEKALIDLDEQFSVSQGEYLLLDDIFLALQPMKLAIEALGRRDANLLTADGILKFVFSQLDNNDPVLHLELKISLEKRVRERIQNDIFGVLKYLHDPDSILEENLFFVPQKSSIYKTIKSLLCRLYPKLEHYDLHEELNSQQSQEMELNIRSVSSVIECQKLSDQLEASILSSTVPIKIDRNNFDSIRKEIRVFEVTKKRTENLDLLYQAICTVPPTSVESERAFSAAGLFITKLRSRLSNTSIDRICFLRSYLGTKKNIK